MHFSLSAKPPKPKPKKAKDKVVVVCRKCYNLPPKDSHPSSSVQVEEVVAVILGRKQSQKRHQLFRPRHLHLVAQIPCLSPAAPL